MDKKSYKALKGIQERVKAGKASFAERTIARIVAKRKRKGLKVTAPKQHLTK